MEDDRTLGILELITIGYWFLIGLTGSFLIGSKLAELLGLPTDWDVILGFVFFGLFLLVCRNILIWEKQPLKQELDEYTEKYGVDVGNWHMLGSKDIENMDENGNVLTDKTIRNQKKKK